LKLPMAQIAECRLDEVGLGAQLDRYRRLAAWVARSERRDARLHTWFSELVDLELLTLTVDTERGCCAFLEIDYRAADRRLSIGGADPDRASALDAIQSALAPAT
jgi:hypothetical protein